MHTQSPAPSAPSVSERTHASIPVVSLRDYVTGSEDTRARFVQVFGDALAEFGFVSVKDHGIDPARIRDAYAQIARFFALPTPEKKKSFIEGSGGNRGYVAFGAEHAKNRKVGDLKEFFHVGRDLPALGPGGANAFPSAVPEFEPSTRTLFTDLERTAGTLLEALAIYFQAPTDTFTKMIAGGNSILRLIHYPPLKDGFIPGGVRAAEHEDINLLTLLCESTSAGLEILTRDGRWLAVEAPPGHIVVDSGDMMQLITNGRLPSTTHRVVNPPSEAEDVVRYSMPFFVHPYPTCPLAPLPFCVSDEQPAKYDATTAQGFLEKRLRELGLL
ncbi:Oxidoreductase [Labilithrix luteola]|uniref:2-oxoglutarate-dependent ethylene/succinate-forming enzyme n=1 Tax=Labilithrix luteola TaxID=1391654 RepID=A0A0K1QE39_9BACT|nr:2-oxoglutarate and iron-dependent oxygenase domain-containing protein [Labilithrix luteola]AKV03927.1 Oxidoreductase [Labilithrix luteola]